MNGAPFVSFARYSPAGTPQDVAGALLPYVEAGCSSVNLVSRAGDRDEALAGVVEVRRLLVEAASGRRATEAPQVARSSSKTPLRAPGSGLNHDQEDMT